MEKVKKILSAAAPVGILAMSMVTYSGASATLESADVTSMLTTAGQVVSSTISNTISVVPLMGIFLVMGIVTGLIAAIFKFRKGGKKRRR